MDNTKYLKITIYNPITDGFRDTTFWQEMFTISSHYGGQNVLDDGLKVELILPQDVALENWAEIALHDDFVVEEVEKPKGPHPIFKNILDNFRRGMR